MSFPTDMKSNREFFYSLFLFLFYFLFVFNVYLFYLFIISFVFFSRRCRRDRWGSHRPNEVMTWRVSMRWNSCLLDCSRYPSSKRETSQRNEKFPSSILFIWYILFIFFKKRKNILENSEIWFGKILTPNFKQTILW